MKTYYKFNKTFNDTSIICEGSILVVVETPTFKKNGSEGKTKVEIFCQGQDSLISIAKFNLILSSGVLDKIEETPELIKYVNDYVIEPKEFSDRKKILSQAKSKMPQFSSEISTFSTWIFSTKGSSAVNISTEKEFQNNPEKFLNETIFRGGMKAKPGSAYKNRGTRQTSISNVDSFEKDETTLLPNGIRISDSCSYEENIKLFDERLVDILSMTDVPQELTDFFAIYGYFARTRKSVDYFYKTPISFDLFKKNTHHAKVKGLEFCHINPEVEYTTTAENTIIGTSESNRHQGGYSFDFTWRKQLIMRIYDKMVTDENHFNLQSELDKLTNDELEKMYFEIKFQK